MKKSILAIVAMATITACSKTETKTVDSNNDTTAIVIPADSTLGTIDSTETDTKVSEMTALSDQDKDFSTKAAQGGLLEVMLGELAATNASNTAVKSLGAMMVKDHSKANDELKNWAATVGYTLPNKLDAEKQKIYDDLKNKKGQEFDRSYTDLMVKDHKEDIADFKKEATSGSEPSLKEFASKTISTLEHHLKYSEEAKNLVK